MYSDFIVLFQDFVGGFGPSEGLGITVVLVDVVVDGSLQGDDGMKDAAANAPAG